MAAQPAKTVTVAALAGAAFAVAYKATSKYLTKKQYIHATVLLEDSLSLWTTNLSQLPELQQSHNDLLNTKNELEEELRRQLYEQIYFKTTDLRENIVSASKHSSAPCSASKTCRGLAIAPAGKPGFDRV